MTICARFRLIVAAVALLFCAALAAPGAAQQPNSVDPNAAAVKEQQLLQDHYRIQGLGSIPDTKSYVIEQPHRSGVARCFTRSGCTGSAQSLFSADRRIARGLLFCARTRSASRAGARDA